MSDIFRIVSHIEINTAKTVVPPDGEWQSQPNHNVPNEILLRVILTGFDNPCISFLQSVTSFKNFYKKCSKSWSIEVQLDTKNTK